MAGSSYDALQTKKRELIRKALNGSVFVADVSADPITALTDATDKKLSALPTGYTDVGWLTDDGMQFSRNVDESDITSFGSTEPTRSDKTSDSTSLQIVCQETRLQTLGLYTGADMTGVTPLTGSGEIQIAKPATPKDKYYRVLAVAVDQNSDGSGEIYIARFLPSAKVTAWGDQQLANADAAVGYDVTFTAFIDETLGYSEKQFIGGPGWTSLLTAAGFTTTP